MKRAIINLVNERGNYIAGQERLRQSLFGKTDADILFFQSEQSVGAPQHIDNPYAFKLYAFLTALQKGYEQVLWLDASVYVIDDLRPVWDKISEQGYIMQEIGHWVGNWCNDKTLEYFNISRDEAMTIPCYGNAGFLGIDINNATATQFFCLWTKAMLSGCFIGEWNNDNKTESEDERCRGHRHDLACGSIIAHKIGMKLEKGDEWLQYAAPEDPVNNNTIIFKAQGV